MTNRIFGVIIFFVHFLGACQSQTTARQNVEPPQQTQPATNQEPNYNYYLKVPDDWSIRDTVMQDGLRVRFILAPELLIADHPAGNVIIVAMEGRTIEDFIGRNINYLQSNAPGITILERGAIDSTKYNGQWFTYTRDQNSVIRDMINYIIPLNGFAYMITFGSNKGTINKYRATFDKIARSFKG